MSNSNNNYVDNKKMYEELVKYNDSVKKYNEDNKNPIPKVNNYLGECFILIANNLATRPQFVNYIFKDEMIADSIENCLTYIHNFDDKKFNNPFAYFTQIIYYAFLRRIYKEKRQLYIKHKTSENNFLFQCEIDDEFFDLDIETKTYANNMIDNYKMNNIVKGFEENLTRKKNKRKKE